VDECAGDMTIDTTNQECSAANCGKHKYFDPLHRKCLARGQSCETIDVSDISEYDENPYTLGDEIKNTWKDGAENITKWCISEKWCKTGCESGEGCPATAPKGFISGDQCMSECPEDTFLDLEAGECKDKKECVDKEDGIMYFYDAANKSCDFYCHTPSMYADLTGNSTEPRMCISQTACLGIEENGVKIAFLDEVNTGKLRCVRANDCPNNGVDSIYETINDKLHVDLRVAENYTGNNISDSSTYRKCILVSTCKSRNSGGLAGYHYLAGDIWNNTCVRVNSAYNGCGTMVGDDVRTYD